MRYFRREPSQALQDMVVCYWVVDSEGDGTIQRQKIIPDGYPEIILHYGDPYRTNISGDWVEQSKMLVAGQIRNHFFLENTGCSGMIGIKLQPTALYERFGLDMGYLTDKVEPLAKVLKEQCATLESLMQTPVDPAQMIDGIEKWLLYHHPQNQTIPVRKALNLIFKTHGLLDVKALAKGSGVVERHLERLFKRQVGLSPKFFSRVVRFNHLFGLIEENDFSWAHLAFKTGFFDQSHFIRNFQEFTGEDPTGYAFENENMANFFMKK